MIYDTKDVSPESCDGDGQKSTKLSDKPENNLKMKSKFGFLKCKINPQVDFIFWKLISDCIYLNSKVACEREYKGVAIGVLQ